MTPHFETTRPLLLVSLFTLLLLAGCSPDSAGEDETTVLFRNISVIDAVDGLREGRSVLVQGNRIVRVAPAGEISEPADARVVDGTGKYLLPGLWDAHVHLTNTPAMRPAMFPLFIANGITYVRDTSALLDEMLPIRERAREAAPQGLAPDVYLSGPHIEGPQISWASSVSAESVEQARDYVDMLEEAGVDEIKLYELLPRDLYHAVLSRAGEKGLKVSAHVPLTMDVVEASEAGLASMEHMQNLELSCSSDWEALLAERREMIAGASELSGNELRGRIHSEQRLRAMQSYDQERCEQVIRILAENRTWQVPTLTITALDEHRVYERREWRQTFRYLPDPVRADWEERADNMAGQSLYDEADTYLSWVSGVLPKLADAGVGIMAGTDMPLVLLTPGFSLHQELVLLVRAGLTPLQAIEAATLRPAQYFGLEHRQGAVAEGLVADLLLLDANPLEEIANTQRIHAVMRNGRLHSREDLDAMLSQLEER